MRSISSTAALVGVCVAGTGAALAATAPSWDPPPATPITTAAVGTPTSFAYLASGATVVAFAQPLGRDYLVDHIFTAQRAAGGAFATARDLVALPQHAHVVTPGVDSAGDVVVAYTRKGELPSTRQLFEHVLVRIAARGGAIGGPVNIGGSSLAVSPALAVASNGAAALTFDERRTGGGWQAMLSMRRPGGRFGAPTAIPGVHPGQGTASIAVDGGGHVAIAWGLDGKLVATSGTAGSLAAPQAFATPGRIPAASTAAGDGRVVVAWLQPGASQKVDFCDAALGEPGQPLAAPVNVSDGCGDPPGTPAVVITSDGYAVLAAGIAAGTSAQQPSGQGGVPAYSTQLETFVAPPSGVFASGQTVFKGSDLVDLALAAGTHGDALVASTDVAIHARKSSDFDIVHAAVSTSQGVFGPASVISHQPPALGVEAAGVGPAGQLDVAWSSGSGFYVATGDRG